MTPRLFSTPLHDENDHHPRCGPTEGKEVEGREEPEPQEQRMVTVAPGRACRGRVAGGLPLAFYSDHGHKTERR